MGSECVRRLGAIRGDKRACTSAGGSPPSELQSGYPGARHQNHSSWYAMPAVLKFSPTRTEAPKL